MALCSQGVTEWLAAHGDPSSLARWLNWDASSSAEHLNSRTSVMSEYLALSRWLIIHFVLWCFVLAFPLIHFASIFRESDWVALAFALKPLEVWPLLLIVSSMPGWPTQSVNHAFCYCSSIMLSLWDCKCLLYFIQGFYWCQHPEEKETDCSGSVGRPQSAGLCV